MPEGIVRSETEIKAWQQEQLTMQAKAQADAMLEGLMEQAAKAGMNPQQAFAMVAQQVGPAMGGTHAGQAQGPVPMGTPVQNEAMQ